MFQKIVRPQLPDIISKLPPPKKIQQSLHLTDFIDCGSVPSMSQISSFQVFCAFQNSLFSLLLNKRQVTIFTVISSLYHKAPTMMNKKTEHLFKTVP